MLINLLAEFEVTFAMIAKTTQSTIPIAETMPTRVKFVFEMSENQAHRCRGSGSDAKTATASIITATISERIEIDAETVSVRFFSIFFATLIFSLLKLRQPKARIQPPH